MADTHKTIAAVLDRHGELFSAEIGADLSKNTPAPLFQWLLGCILMSARIQTGNALRGTKALIDAGWTTAENLKDSSWKQRVKVLNENGHARSDEKTASLLDEVADHAMQRWEGDLRKLREEADGDASRAETLLQEFKGLGPAGAAIFLREAQLAWAEFHPYADKKALETADKLGLPKTSKGLADHVPQADFPRLLAGLVRAGLAKDIESLKAR